VDHVLCRKIVKNDARRNAWIFFTKEAGMLGMPRSFGQKQPADGGCPDLPAKRVQHVGNASIFMPKEICM
jgi:hypothetical protein